jgi:dihydrofolate reductase
VVQGNGGASDEDRRNGFERGGWAKGAGDDETRTLITQTYQRADAFLFGRRTYELFAGSWGAIEEMRAHPIGVALNETPKYVASATLTEPRWADTTVLSGDLAAAIGGALTSSQLRVPGGEHPFRDAEPADHAPVMAIRFSLHTRMRSSASDDPHRSVAGRSRRLGAQSHLICMPQDADRHDAASGLEISADLGWRRSPAIVTRCCRCSEGSRTDCRFSERRGWFYPEAGSGSGKRRGTTELPACVNRRCGHGNGPPGSRAGRPVIAGRTSHVRPSGARGLVAIPAAELLHPPGAVEDARLPGVERVAR